jgi:glycosyltransferase involved in cell wall biosynthesis
MVLIEAMAMGVPVVAPASGGPAEIVDDGRTGLLYPPGDTAAAAAQILRLLRDEALAKSLREAAVEEARTRWSKERQVKDHRQILTNLL